MTKKDFELIAKVIAGLYVSEPDLSEDGLKQVIEGFVDELYRVNPRFDSVRFRVACGMGRTKGIKNVRGE